MPDPLSARAEEVKQLVAQYTLRKQGSSLDTVLNAALEAIQRSARELYEAASLLAAFQNGAKDGFPLSQNALSRILTSNEAIRTDPVAYADSADGQELVRVLADAARELDTEANRLWAHLHAELDGDYPEDFVDSMTRVQAFAAEARAVKEAHETVRRALDMRRPDAAAIERARRAKKDVEERLQRLNDLVPADVRGQFADALDGTLLLTEVESNLLNWIAEKRLEQTFRVTVR